MLSDEDPTTLDCLVMGHLALAAYSKLPHSWLEEAIRVKFPTLLDYIHENRRHFLGGPVTLQDVLIGNEDAATDVAPAPSGNEKSADDEDRLPWASPALHDISQIGAFVLHEMLDSLPVVRQIRHAVASHMSQ
jgi:sorting and assembly machinery component 37